MLPASSQPACTLWTIGHSNHALDVFLDLLTQGRIEVLADVRSSPYSRYAVQFNRESLRPALQNRSIEYRYFGDRLGGRIDDPNCYDEAGHVLYDRVAALPAFRQAIEELLAAAGKARLAILCGEEDPTDCHRRLLVGRVAGRRGAAVMHIRGDGRIQSEEQLAAEERFRKTKGQLNLFDTEETGAWKSTQSVSPRKPPPSSSMPCEGLEFGD